MRVLMFLSRFAEPIRLRTKRQTIRQRRNAYPIQPGELLSLREWSGRPYRSRQRAIVAPVLCEAVRTIRIAVDGPKNTAWIAVGEHVLSHDETCRFVRSDGFDCVSDFVDHWLKKGVVAFDGVLIEWTFATEEQPR